MAVQPTVYVVDDEPAIRLLIQRILEPQGLTAVACASAEEFFAAGQAAGPACVVLDLRLGAMNGLEVMREYRQRGGQAPVIVLTAFGSVPLAVDSMKGGAFDFVAKPFAAAQLLEKVQAALAADRLRLLQAAELQTARERFAGLTPREMEILQAISDGKPSKIIAYECGISVRTVEHHRANILVRTGAHNVAHLVLLAVRSGIVTLRQENGAPPVEFEVAVG